MKLGTQLLLASTLTLALPVLAFRAIHQLDAALRQERTNGQLERVLSAKALLEASGELDNLNSEPAVASVADATVFRRALYAERINHRIFLDGYNDDWVGLRQPALLLPFRDGQSRRTTPEESDVGKVHDDVAGHPDDTTDASNSIQLQTALSATHLYLFIRVPDDRLVFHDPSKGLVGTGDQIDIRWQPLNTDADHLNHRHFSPVASGELTARYYGRRYEGLQPVLTDGSVRGALAVTNDGYQVELQLPRVEENGYFAVTVIDRDQSDDLVLPGGEFGQNSRPYRWAGLFNPANPEYSTSYMVYPSDRLQHTVTDVVPAGSRLRIFDRAGRLRADVNRLYEYNKSSGLIDPQRSSLFNAVLYRFFEWVIRSRQPLAEDPFTPEVPYQLLDVAEETGGQPLIYKTYADDHVTGLMKAVPDAVNQSASLLFETNEDRSNAFTSSAMVRVFSIVTLFSILVAVSLLLFASWLSLRIRRLSNQARQVVNTDGRFVSEVHSSQQRDEIGDLSRDLATLVERSRGYTQYLEGLSSKLSHELRTPLSVVQTSLENIDLDELDISNRQLVNRAQSGSSQLSRLLRSMSEAARLEQSISRAEFSHIDLHEWLTSLSAAYQSIYPALSITHSLSAKPLVARVVPELLQQATDKLVSNAADFSIDGGEIRLLLSRQKTSQRIVLAVENDGSELAPAMLDSLFEPMVTNRKANGDSAAVALDSTAATDTQISSLSRIYAAEENHAPHLGLGLYIVRLVAETHLGQPFAQNTETGVRIGFHFQSRSD